MLVQQEMLLGPARPAATGRPAVRGPAAVRASLVAAASELFAARGTAAVSVREIAERAGVNHGLIHHYFHSKQGLIDATLEELAAQATKSLEHGADFSPEGPLSRYLLVASRVLLDAEPGEKLDGPERMSGLAELLRRLAETGPRLEGQLAAARPAAADERPGPVGSARYQARLRAVHLAVLLIGLLLFEPVLLEAAGLADEDAARVREALIAATFG